MFGVGVAAEPLDNTLIRIDAVFSVLQQESCFRIAGHIHKLPFQGIAY